jgi:hypothetical protein
MANTAEPDAELIDRIWDEAIERGEIAVYRESSGAH